VGSGRTPLSCLCGFLGRRVFGSVGVVCTSATYPPVLLQTNVSQTDSILGRFP
jgi:hypothetical protein